MDAGADEHDADPHVDPDTDVDAGAHLDPDTDEDADPDLDPSADRRRDARREPGARPVEHELDADPRRPEHAGPRPGHADGHSAPHR